MSRVCRVLVAKCGLDGHDRGAKLVARVLAEAGVEVIYTGKFLTVDQVVETALQEDVDGIGLSLLSGSHMTLVPRVLERLTARDAASIPVFVGGTIMPDDEKALLELGVDRVFPSGSSLSEITSYVSELGKAA